LLSPAFAPFNTWIVLGGTSVESDPVQNRGTAFGKTNVIPRRVVAHGGLRTISDEQLQRARAALRNVVARHLPRTSAEITFSDGYPAMAPTEANRRLLEVYSDVNEALGRERFLELEYARLRDTVAGYRRGSLVLPDGSVIPGYPSIGRVQSLGAGLRRHYSGAFWVEEKMDGFNVRIFRWQGRTYAATRGGYICAFSTDRLPDLLDSAILDDEPSDTPPAVTNEKGDPVVQYPPPDEDPRYR
jgi:hypothetical protein